MLLLDRAHVATLIFKECLMRGKDFTTETRRHGGIPEWVRGGAATWPGTAVLTAGGDPGPLNYLTTQLSHLPTFNLLVPASPGWDYD